MRSWIGRWVTARESGRGTSGEESGGAHGHARHSHHIRSPGLSHKRLAHAIQFSYPHFVTSCPYAFAHSCIQCDRHDRSCLLRPSEFPAISTCKTLYCPHITLMPLLTPWLARNLARRAHTANSLLPHETRPQECRACLESILRVRRRWIMVQRSPHGYVEAPFER